MHIRLSRVFDPAHRLLPVQETVRAAIYSNESASLRLWVRAHASRCLSLRLRKSRARRRRPARRPNRVSSGRCDPSPRVNGSASKSRPRRGGRAARNRRPQGRRCSACPSRGSSRHCPPRRKRRARRSRLSSSARRRLRARRTASTPRSRCRRQSRSRRSRRRLRSVLERSCRPDAAAVTQPQLWLLCASLLTMQRKRKEAKQLKSWLSKDALRRMLEEPRCLWKVRSTPARACADATVRPLPFVGDERRGARLLAQRARGQFQRTR